MKKKSKKKTTPITQQKMEKIMEKIYEAEGQDAVFDAVLKYPNINYQYCQGCEVKSPVYLKPVCLVCGSSTTKEKQ